MSKNSTDSVAEYSETTFGDHLEAVPIRATLMRFHLHPINPTAWLQFRGWSGNQRFHRTMSSDRSKLTANIRVKVRWWSVVVDPVPLYIFKQ